MTPMLFNENTVSVVDGGQKMDKLLILMRFSRNYTLGETGSDSAGDEKQRRPCSGMNTAASGGARDGAEGG